LDIVKLIIDLEYEDYDNPQEKDIKKNGLERVDVFSNTIFHIAAYKVYLPYILLNRINMTFIDFLTMP